MRRLILFISSIALAAAFTTSWALGMGMGGGMHKRGMGMGGGMMGPPSSVGENPLPADGAILAAGTRLYAANCAVCHGDTGRGDGPAAAGLNPRPPDLRGASSRWDDGQLAAQILNGRGAMPGFAATLAQDDVWSIVHYLRRLQR